MNLIRKTNTSLKWSTIVKAVLKLNRLVSVNIKESPMIGVEKRAPFIEVVRFENLRKHLKISTVNLT